MKNLEKVRLVQEEYTRLYREKSDLERNIDYIKKYPNEPRLRVWTGYDVCDIYVRDLSCWNEFKDKIINEYSLQIIKLQEKMTELDNKITVKE